MSTVNLKLNKVNPVKLGLIYGLAMVAIVLVMAVFFSLFSGILFASLLPFLGNEFPEQNEILDSFRGGGVFFFMALFGSITYFCFGFLIGWIGGLILNLILPKIGGLNLTFQTESASIVTKSENSNLS